MSEATSELTYEQLGGLGQAGLVELLEVVMACERRARGQVAWTFAAEGQKS